MFESPHFFSKFEYYAIRKSFTAILCRSGYLNVTCLFRRMKERGGKKNEKEGGGKKRKKVGGGKKKEKEGGGKKKKKKKEGRGKKKRIEEGGNEKKKKKETVEWKEGVREDLVIAVVIVAAFEILN